MSDTATAKPMSEEEITYDVVTPKKLFGSKVLGTTIYGEFECTNRHHFGSLYMGSKALCFYGKLFGLERRFNMPYGDVCAIERYKSNGIMIRVKSSDKNSTPSTITEDHVFYIDLSSLNDKEASENPLDVSNMSMNSSTSAASDMDDVLNLLLDLKERHKSGFLAEDDDANNVYQRPTIQNSMRMSVKYMPHPMYRSNTDPLTMEEVDEEDETRSKHVHFQNQEEETPSRKSRPTMAGQHTNSQALAAVTAMADFRSFSAVYDSQEKLQVLAKLTHDLEHETAEDNKHEDDGPEEMEDLVTKPENMEEAWKILKETTAPSYKEYALQSIDLACNLDTFFKTFFSNDASHSLAKYMENNGDREVVTSKWKTTRKGFVNKRTVSYVHPVNAPMAPPQAAAKKHQWLRRYGTCGLVIDTRTQVEDVPMTDCFLMEDRILVEPNGQGVTLHARFEVRFVKSTMFRRIIEKTSKEEFLKFIKGFGQMIVKEVGQSKAEEDKPKVALEVAPSTPDIAAPQAMSTEFKLIFIIVIGFLLLIHLALLMEVYSLVSSVHSLNATIKDLQAANFELMSEATKAAKYAATATCSTTAPPL